MKSPLITISPPSVFGLWSSELQKLLYHNAI